MSEGGAYTGAMGIHTLVGTGRGGCAGDADGGSGGGTDGGVGGDGRGRDGYILSQWVDNIASLNLGTDPNDPLDYDLVL